MKKIPAIVVCICLAAALGACSKKAETASLEFFSTKPENTATLQKLVDRFNTENEDLKLTLVAPADPSTVLRARLTKNDIPDIIALGGDATYSELADSGMLLDIGDQRFVNDINAGYKAMLHAVQKDKTKLFAVPYATNGSGVLYNKEVFARQNMPVPLTWDDFIAAANRFKAAGVNPFLLTFADSWTTLPSWNSMAPVLTPPGLTARLADGSAAFTGTHEEILRKYLQILSLSGNDFMGTGYNDGNNAFARGEGAMMINGNWAIAEYIKANPDIQVGLFVFPASNDSAKNNVTSGVDVGFAVSASTKNKDLALKFVEFMTRAENAQQYIDEQFAFSAINGVFQGDPSVQDINTAIAEGRISDFPDHYYPAGFDLTAILSQFALNYKNGMGNDQNIRETLEKCDAEYQALR